MWAHRREKHKHKSGLRIYHRNKNQPIPFNGGRDLKCAIYVSSGVTILLGQKYWEYGISAY